MRLWGLTAGHRGGKERGGGLLRLQSERDEPGQAGQTDLGSSPGYAAYIAMRALNKILHSS